MKTLTPTPTPTKRTCPSWCTGEAHDDIAELCVGADIAVPTAGDVKVGLSDDGSGPRVELLMPGMLTLSPGEAVTLIAALQTQVDKARGKAPATAQPARGCAPFCVEHDEEMHLCLGESLTAPGGKFNEPCEIGLSYEQDSGPVVSAGDRYMLLHEARTYTLALLRQIEKAQKTAPLAVCA